MQLKISSQLLKYELYDSTNTKPFACKDELNSRVDRLCETKFADSHTTIQWKVWTERYLSNKDKQMFTFVKIWIYENVYLNMVQKFTSMNRVGAVRNEIGLACFGSSRETRYYCWMNKTKGKYEIKQSPHGREVRTTISPTSPDEKVLSSPDSLLR